MAEERPPGDDPGCDPAPPAGDGAGGGAGSGAHGGRPARRVWYVLWAWIALWAAVRLPGAGGSWHYFALGSHALFDDDAGDGLHVYAAHPELQMGPLAFVVATPLRLLGTEAGRVAAVGLMTATGPLILASVWRLVPYPARRPSRLLAAGLVVLPAWVELGMHAGHLDDVLALACAVAAMHTLVRERPIATGLLIAAAVDAKPWAAGFVPMLFALPRGGRWAAAAVCASGIAVAWLPFLLYDPGTLAVTRFTIPTAASSGLRVLGVTDPRTPGWDRPVQLLLGTALGAAAMRRGRWAAVPLLAILARILLDPEVYSYYTAGVLVGAVTFDLLLTRSRLPWVSIAGLAGLRAARLAAHVLPISQHDLGVLRVVYVVAVVTVALLPGADRRGAPGGSGHATPEADRPVRAVRPATDSCR